MRGIALNLRNMITKPSETIVHLLVPLFISVLNIIDELAAAALCRGLDVNHMMQTAELLGRLKSPERYIFVITHDYEFILSACDEVIEIENGVLKNDYLLDEKGLQTLQTFYFDGE